MAIAVDNFLRLIPELRDIPAHSAQVTYDQEGDVLYVNFDRGAVADESDEVAPDVIARYKSGAVIGYTILNASHHGMAQ